MKIKSVWHNFQNTGPQYGTLVHVKPINGVIPPYIRILSSDWLMKGVFLFTNSSFFQLFHHCRDSCLKISQYYRKISRSRQNPFFKQFMTSRMLFELLGFLLSTNAKVQKMTTVSAVMLEIVEMYIFQIHLHYFFQRVVW